MIYASRQSAHPADQAHPYGHARMETAATLVLGVSLVLIGGGILWESGLRLQHRRGLPVVELSALWIAIATVISKEGLYRYLIRVAERQRSHTADRQCAAYPGRRGVGAGRRGRVSAARCSAGPSSTCWRRR